MFCIIYEFEVPKQHETEFKTIWHQLTLFIKESKGGLGSRLHQDINTQVWVAYAQWASKEAWESFAPHNANAQESLTTRLREICLQVRIIYQLDMVDDLLVHSLESAV